MGFERPVDTLYSIGTYFREKGEKYIWSIDPDNGVWIPVKDRHGRGDHCGIDFMCPSGTVVRAMADGVIIRARYEDALDAKKGMGLHIGQLVDMPGFDSWQLRYSHLQSVFVKIGDNVKQGQPIAESGKSGNAQFSYLHIDLMDLRHQWKEIKFKGEPL